MGTISKKQEEANKLQKEIKLIEDASNSLKEKLNDANEDIKLFTEVLKHLKGKKRKNSMWSITSECERELSNAKKNKETYEKQIKCDHDIVWDQYDGHDSHKDYYVSKCKHCNLLVNSYDY